LDHADWQWITTEYQTGVEEGTGSRSSWRVVATDLSCLRVMMMVMFTWWGIWVYDGFLEKTEKGKDWTLYWKRSGKQEAPTEARSYWREHDHREWTGQWRIHGGLVGFKHRMTRRAKILASYSTLLSSMGRQKNLKACGFKRASPTGLRPGLCPLRARWRHCPRPRSPRSPVWQNLMLATPLELHGRPKPDRWRPRRPATNTSFNSLSEFLKFFHRHTL